MKQEKVSTLKRKEQFTKSECSCEKFKRPMNINLEDLWK